MSKIRVIHELLLFVRESRKYWLVPILVTLVLTGILLLVAKGSALAPFIYALF
jgi:hypothetical protein